MRFKKWLEVFDNIQAGSKFIWVDADSNEQLPGPACDRHSSALFQAGSHDYKVTFEIIDDGIVNVDFVTKKRGVFLTNEGIPFTVMNQVMAALRQYADHCKIKGFEFMPESFERLRVFRRIIGRMMPDFEERDGLFVRKSV